MFTRSYKFYTYRSIFSIIINLWDRQIIQKRIHIVISEYFSINNQCLNLLLFFWLEILDLSDNNNKKKTWLNIVAFNKSPRLHLFVCLFVPSHWQFFFYQKNIKKIVTFIVKINWKHASDVSPHMILCYILACHACRHVIIMDGIRLISTLITL